MLKAYPIDTGVAMTTVGSDLHKIDWSVNHVTADFYLPERDGLALRVHFAGANIVRLLDEMPLSTEDDALKAEGYVLNHFAYRVEGSTFEATQSPDWKAIMGPVSHYQFVTGFGCMDVLCPCAPSFEVVPIANS